MVGRNSFKWDVIHMPYDSPMSRVQLNSFSYSQSCASIIPSPLRIISSPQKRNPVPLAIARLHLFHPYSIAHQFCLYRRPCSHLPHKCNHITCGFCDWLFSFSRMSFKVRNSLSEKLLQIIPLFRNTHSPFWPPPFEGYRVNVSHLFGASKLGRAGVPREVLF